MPKDNSLVLNNPSCKVLSDKEKKVCIEQLRELVLSDNLLKKYRTYDDYLLRFLHCTDFNINFAFKRMQEYGILISKYPDWFPLTFSPKIKSFLERNAKAFLIERDRCGRRIFVVHLRKIDWAKTSPSHEAQIDEIWFELVMDDPLTQTAGISIIIDVKGASWKVLQWLTPQTMQVSSKKADLYPCKEIVYHIVNTSILTNTIQKCVWPFVSEKVKKTVFFHFNNWSSLHEHIGPDILPEEYGGTASDIDFQKLTRILLEQDKNISDKIRHRLYEDTNQDYL